MERVEPLAMSLTNLRIAGKLAVLSGAFAAILLVMAGIAGWKARETDRGIALSAEANEGVKVAGRMHQTVLAMAIEQYQLAREFNPRTLAQTRTDLTALRRTVQERMAAIEAMGGARRMQALAETRRAYVAFDTALDAALAVGAASERANDWSPEASARFATAAAAAGQPLDALRASLVALGDVADTVATEFEQAAQAAARQLTWLMGLLAALGLAGTGFLGWLIGARMIGRPLAASAGRLRALADGDTDTAIPFAGRRDEVGDIAGAMAVFREKLIASRAMQDAAGAEAAAKAARADRVAALTRGFETETAGVVKTVAAAATEMEATASAMAGGAEAAARQAGTVRNAAGEASANVQQVAAAAEELAASVGEITRQMAESSRMAGEAVSEAGRTRAAVGSLSDKANRIGEVVRLINEIAAQTNLLALNATIEAARAGEAGKGFAVVASEVKSLAAQTGRATEEIAGQVQAVQGDTARVVAAIAAMGQVIERINEIATAIAAAVEQQGAATAEIARNVNQAAQGTGTVTASIAGVDEAAAQSGAAATQVQAAARELSRGAEALRGQIDRFLDQMRAA
jgi:methyl-accepting chemotaxis protein